MPRKTRRQLLPSLLLGSLLVALPLSVAAQSQQACRSETELPSSTPTSRFIDHMDGTVTDEDTGLMWAKCAEGLAGALCDQGTASLFSWNSALGISASSTHANYTDWRVPNIKELQSIVEQRCVAPAINQSAEVFPNTPVSGLSAFWTSSPSVFNASDVWVVEFLDGDLGNSSRGSSLNVRLVRTANGASNIDS